MRGLLLLVMSAYSIAFHGEYVDDTVCLLCPSSSYCVNGSRFACPEHSFTDPLEYPSTVDACICEGGYHRIGDVCENGTAPQYYVDGQQLHCPANMLTVIDFADSASFCVCDTGFEKTGSDCAACPAGKFKNTTGDQACLTCEGGTFTNSTGHTVCEQCAQDQYSLPGDTICTDCRPQSTAPAGSDHSYDCECVKGFEFDNLQCEECAAGKYKDTISNDDQCQLCDPNAFSLAGSIADTACLCNIGFSGPDGGECTACAKGTFKNVTGDADCLPCAANTFANLTAMTRCHDCVADSSSTPGSDSVEDCACDDTFVRIGTQLEPICTSCLPGEFSANGQCHNCSFGTFSTQYGATHCDSCPANSSSYTLPRVDCQCSPGYKCVVGATCPDGVCEACPANTFADTPGWRAECSDCHSHSQSLPGSDHQDDCQCSTAYYEASDHVCEPCAPGTFTSILDASECTVCAGDYKFTPVVPINSQADCIDCVLCDDDQYDSAPCTGLTASNCQNCPDDTGTSHSANPSDPNIGIESCSCDANFYGVLGGPCNVCQPPKVCDGILTKQHVDDHFCAEDSCVIRLSYGNALTCREFCSNHGLLCEDATHIASWESCASGGSIGCDSLQNSMVCNCGYIEPLAEKVRTAGRVATDTTHQDCHCQVGHYHVSDILCEPCQVGSYKDVAGDATTCTACADGFTTLTTGSTSVNDCMCPPGHFLDGDSCAACPENTFKYVISNATACSPCRNHSVAGIGSTEEIQCECEPGYYLFNGICTECPAGSIKSNVSNDACTLCPPDTFMPDANSAATECLPCAADESTHGTSGNAQCSCVAGMEFTYQCDTSTWPDVNSQCGGCEVLIGNPTSSPAVSMDGKSCDQYCASFDRTCTGAKAKSGNAYMFAACESDLWFVVECSQIRTGTYRKCECSSDIATCEVCPDNEFRTDVINTQTCTECDSCRGNDWRVDLACTPTQNRVCKGCQDDSNLPFWDETSTFCHCNAGYEADEANDACVACLVGKYKTTNSNNSISCQTCAAGKKALSTAMAECDDCEPNCPVVNGVEQYVTAECTPTSSIVCTDCTPCQTGYYSKSHDNSTTDTTCGVHFNNDRNDTVCALCEQGFYCVDGVRYSCGANSFSATGSSQLSDCGCSPGFYATAEHGCQVCPRDFYCPGGVGQTLIPCPVNSVNNYEGGTHVLDCNCLHGFYRTDQTETNFTCTLCTVNDYCYNNSAYNCSDSRQISQAGSSEQSHCICIDGWYNAPDDTCLECPFDSFCSNGTRFLCAPDRWTQNQTRQEDVDQCLCRPGLYDDNQVCAECLAEHYCVGDNNIEECPDHSTTLAGASDLFGCECKMGYENSSYPGLDCVRCIQNQTFKNLVGNFACQPCSRCSVAEHNEYADEACVPEHDAVCDTCGTCVAGQTYVEQRCEDWINTGCTACSECNFAMQYEQLPCITSRNTQCEFITFDLTCPIGQFRGGHTTTSDSVCAQCQYSDTKFLGATLHEPKDHGQVYNQANSCPVRCLGISKLRDENDHSQGCVSCETGNVLLKEFTVVENANGDQVECAFTCRGDYVLQNGDCVTPALMASDANTGAHRIQITNFERSVSGSLLTIVHSNHSRFVVTVGQTAPTNCDTIRGCCYAQQWRVSTLRQAGFGTDTTSDGCSQTPLLSSTQLSMDSLSFEISDDMLPTVATCSSSNAIQECHLVVAIVDTIVWSTTMQSVQIQTHRSGQHVAVMGLTQYIALDVFDVQVMKAYYTEAGSVVYVIQTRLSGPAIQADMRVMGMTQLDVASVTECDRLSISNASVVLDTSVLPVSSTETQFVTYWVGTDDIVRAYYAVKMEHGVAQDIVAVRNLADFPAVCVKSEHTAAHDLAVVWSASGLGADSVHQLTSLPDPSHATHGELGTLTTFIVQAMDSIPVDISLRNLLAVYVRTPATTNLINTYSNITNLQQGILDFTYAFRQFCRAQHGTCAYEYLKVYHQYQTIHQLHNCSTAEQERAITWIKHAYGVVHDGGHVAAMCATILTHPDRSSSGFLVQTQRFLPRSIWMPYMNLSMSSVHMKMWANFQLIS